MAADGPGIPGSPGSIDTWLRAALADAERRGLPDLKPLLESLAKATKALRDAGFTGDAEGAARS